MRLLFFCLIFSILAYFGYKYVNSILSKEHSLNIFTTDAYEDSTAKRSFVLKKGQKLRFSLPKRQYMLTLFTHANFPMEKINSLSSHNKYKIKYQIYDKRHNLLKEFFYYKFVSIPKLQEDNNNLIYKIFYRDQDIMPSSSNLQKIDLLKYPKAQYIHISLDDHDESIQDVIIRAHHYVHNKKTTQVHYWNEMPDSTKERFSKPFIFHHNLLSKQEKDFFVLRESLYLSPTGMEKIDYQSRLLYFKNDSNQLMQPNNQESMIVTKNIKAIIPIKENGDLELSFLPYSLFLKQDTEYKIKANITIYDYQTYTPSFYTTFITYDNSSWKWKNPDIKKGIIEITTSDYVKVRANLSDANKNINIVPEKSYQRLFMLNTSNSFKYSIVHSKDNAYPIKISVRGVRDMEDKWQNDLSFSYEFLNKKGKKINGNIVSWESQPNYYDYIVNQYQNKLISNEKNFYIFAPKEASTIVIKSKKILLIGLYNRPSNPYTQYAQLVADNSQNFSQILNWFRIYPQSSKELIKNNQSVLIVRQKIPRIFSDIKLNVHRQTHVPVNQHKAFYIIEPYKLYKTFNPQLLYSVYTPINSLTNTENFLSADKDIIKPSLIFQQKSDKPFKFEVKQDNIVVASGTVAGLNGIIHLPETAVGSHKLHIQSPSNINWLINYKQPNQLSVRRKLTYLVSKDNPLQFMYEKQTNEQENIMGVFFLNHKRKAPYKILVKLHNINNIINSNNINASNNIATAWTFSKQMVIINPVQSIIEHTHIMGKGDTLLSTGYKFLNYINNNVAKGKYLVTISLIEGDEGYLSFYSNTYKTQAVPRLKIIDSKILINQ